MNASRKVCHPLSSALPIPNYIPPIVELLQQLDDPKLLRMVYLYVRSLRDVSSHS